MPYAKFNFLFFSEFEIYARKKINAEKNQKIFEIIKLLFSKLVNSTNPSASPMRPIPLPRFA